MRGKGMGGERKDALFDCHLIDQEKSSDMHQCPIAKET